MPKLTKRCICLVQTDGLAIIIEKLRFLKYYLPNFSTNRASTSVTESSFSIFRHGKNVTISVEADY